MSPCKFSIIRLSHLFIGLSCLLFSWSNAAAEVLYLETQPRTYDLLPYLQIAAEHDLPAFDLASVAALDYQPLAIAGISIKDQEWYYLRIDLSNPHQATTAATNWILKFPLVLTEAQYVLVKEGQLWQEGRTGFFVPIAERSFLPGAKGNYALLSLSPRADMELYLRVRCDRYRLAPDLRLELSDATTFYEEQKRKTLFNGIFVGFVLLLLLYNLFFFFLARDRAYIYYSVYLGALMMFTVYNTGDLWDWFLGIFQSEKPQVIAYWKLITYTAVIAYLAFLRSFLPLAQLLPKWDRVLKWFALAAIPTLLLDGFLIYWSNYNYDTADVVTLSYFLIFLFLMLWFLIPLARTKDSKRNFIIGGVLAMVFGILLTVIDRMRTVDFTTLYYKIGTIIEVVVFSLGLAYRQREVEQEAQRAEFELERSRLLQKQQEKEAQQLAELDAAKSRFYTHLTHELRTPLTVIKGLQEYLGRELPNSQLSAAEKRSWFSNLELIGRNSDQLLQNINQLLDLARLEAGSLPVHYRQGDVIAYLNYLAESFYSLANERQIRLLFYAECDEQFMDFDENKMQQIVYNLLSNALRHTPAGGKVILHARTLNNGADKYLQLKVSDTGPGIEPEALQRIFDLFYQSDKAESGSGIGLTLTRELVDVLKGELRVESELGKGTVFTIVLPISNKAPLVGEQALATVASVPPLIDLPKEQRQESLDPGATQERPLLLLVEDNADVMAFLEKLLSQDYQLLMAGDGEQGLDLAREHTPDLIISDVMMPKLDGYALCKALKEDARTSHIPVVLLTAKATDADRITGLRTGADAYLMKPFQAEELFLRLENLFRLREQLRAHLKGQLDQAKPQDKPTAAAQEASGKESEFLRRLQAIIKENIDQSKLSTAVLAREMLLSESQLYRKLRALTGQSPSVFVRDQRLAHAAALLQDASLHIAEVAYRSGFNDPNYFSRSFNTKYGCSPRDYRNQLSAFD